MVNPRISAKKGLLFFIVFLRFSTAIAQEYDKVWAVGSSITTMSFSADSVILSKFSGDSTLSCFNTIGSICDSKGNFLFCTNGVSVHNRYGGLMPNGDSLSALSEYYDQVYPAGIPSREGVVILPFPGDSNLYYIFHYTPTDSFDAVAGGVALNLYYSVVDIRRDSGRGDLILKNIPIIQNEMLSFSRMSACKHANGRDWWIIKNAWHKNIYYEFLLTPDGVQGPFVQQIGVDYGLPSNEQPSFACFSPSGSRYASFTSDQSDVVLLDFDRCTGLFSNPVSIINSDYLGSPTNSIGAVGCAFSPNGKYLYVLSNPFELNQYNLQSPNINDSVRVITLPDSDFYEMNICQLAPNDKIYISCWNGGSSSIHVINHPDSLGIACNFLPYGQHVLSVNPQAIPYFPNFRLGSLAGSCDTIHTSITDIVGAHLAFASVYPNPASNRAELFYFTNANSQNYAEIYDISGRLVWRNNNQGGSGTINIDLSAISAGVYMVRFTADDKVLLSTKLVISKW